MNRFCEGTILFASLLLLLSCGGPKDGKSNSNAVTQRKTDSTAKHDSLSAVKQPIVSIVETNENTSKFPEWILIGFILVEGVFIGFLAVKVIKLRENMGNLENKQKRIETEINRFKNDLAGSKSKTQYNTPQPPRQNKPREQEPIAINHEIVDKNDHVHPHAIADSECVFLKHFKDGILEVVSKEQAFYQAKIEVGEKEGRFEFVGDVRKAIANKNSILDDVCETPKFNRDATQIITEKCGKCVKLQDGKWLVTQKAILSLK